MPLSNNIIVPFIGIEFDASGAFTGPSTLPIKALIMGHQLAASTADENKPLLVLNADDAAAQFGIGSQLHQLCIRWFSRNKFTEVYCVVVPEPVGSASEYTLGATGTATAPGTLGVYLDGEYFSVGVVLGEDADVSLANLAVLIDANTDRHCFSLASTAVGSINLGLSYDGALGDEHDVRMFYGSNNKGVQGFVLADPVLVAGAGLADVTDAIAGIKNEWFNVIVCPFNDTTNVGLMETEMARRFGPEVQQDGIVYTGIADTVANTVTYATNVARNSPHIALIDSYKYTQHNMFVACLWASEVTKSIQSDIGQPLHNITIDNLLPPEPIDRKELSDLNTLTTNGVSTLNPHSAGGPQTFGTVTMYLKNSFGINDIAYQYQTTMFILMYLRYDTIVMISTKYPRARLANDASRVRAGIQIVTPSLLRNELIGRALQWEKDGLVENIDAFKEGLVVERSDANVNRLNFLMTPDLVNQFIVGAGVNQFRLN